MTIKRVELIGKKEFIVAVLDPEYEAFVVYVAALNVDSGNEMHPSKKAQIAHLKVDETPSEMLGKYVDFADVFSPKLVAELPEHIGINDHTTKLVDD